MKSPVPNTLSKTGKSVSVTMVSAEEFAAIKAKLPKNLRNYEVVGDFKILRFDPKTHMLVGVVIKRAGR